MELNRLEDKVLKIIQKKTKVEADKVAGLQRQISDLKTDLERFRTENTDLLSEAATGFITEQLGDLEEFDRELLLRVINKQKNFHWSFIGQLNYLFGTDNRESSIRHRRKD